MDGKVLPESFKKALLEYGVNADVQDCALIILNSNNNMKFKKFANLF